MGTIPVREATLDVNDHMVVSVGPYMFHSEELLVRSWLANSRDRASPPQRIFSWSPPCHPASTSNRQVVWSSLHNAYTRIGQFLSKKDSVASNFPADDLNPRAYGERQVKFEPGDIEG